LSKVTMHEGADLSPELIGRLHALSHAQPDEAIRQIRELGKSYSGDIRYEHLKGACFIDAGEVTGDKGTIQEGIAACEGIAGGTKGELRASILYNLANGYGELATIERRGTKLPHTPDSAYLIEAKRAYREAIKLEDCLGADFRAQLHINYANVLSALGRSIEAIREYRAAIAISPSHPMAQGNLGIELAYFSGMARSPAILLEAREALANSLSGNALESIGQQHARAEFARTLAHVEQRLSHDDSSLSREKPRAHSQPRTYPLLERIKVILGISGRKVPQESSYDRYIEFCGRCDLFLNLNATGKRLEDAMRDNVGFSLTTPINERDRFVRLARITNEIKERFAASRLLLYEASANEMDSRPYDGITRYIDNLDYGVYGIRVGKLKVSYEGAFNVLDKIALFLNDYLELGIKEESVYFSSIWRDKDKRFRAEMQGRHNQHLNGLYDLARDISWEGEWESLRDLRNVTTHRYLVPHVEGWGWMTEADGDEYHVGYRRFFGEAIRLHQVVRAAIIYLIAMVDLEERKRRKLIEGTIGRMNAHVYEAWEYGPDDSPV
jgi:tetratricopeptide (TPR) repeat protein